MKKTDACIIAIGNELLTGAVIDTNSAYLASSLRTLGIEINKISLVPDNKNDIQQELKRAIQHSHLLITTGGLGPTSDDLSRWAIAEAAEVSLEVNDAALAKLTQMLERRGRTVNENNRRQVYFPQGAEIIHNRLGTADAFVTNIANSTGKSIPVISLPGVPAELKVIFEEELKPWLTKHLSLAQQAPLSKALRFFGLPEALIGQLIEECKLSENMQVAYRPSFPEILVTLTQSGSYASKELQTELEFAVKKIKEKCGSEYIFSEQENEHMVEVVKRLLCANKLKLAVAESCTGGLIAHKMVSVPGASECFLGAAVGYQNEAKEVLLGVRSAIIKHYGAVSPEVAIELARGAKYRLGADLAISTTGIAGPSGGSVDKPVGTYYVGLVTNKYEKAFKRAYPAERNSFRNYAATAALDIVRREILGIRTTDA